MIPFLSNPVVINAIAEAVGSLAGNNETENKEIAKVILKKHALPFYKDKRVLTAIAAVVGAIASNFLGFPITDLVCGP